VTTDQSIAERAAADLRGYWAERGYAVSVDVECVDGGKYTSGPLYSIRTDLINGLPKGFKAKGFKVKALKEKA
jgi:hypothetical protein